MCESEGVWVRLWTTGNIQKSVLFTSKHNAVMGRISTKEDGQQILLQTQNQQTKQNTFDVFWADF